MTEYTWPTGILAVRLPLGNPKRTLTVSLRSAKLRPAKKVIIASEYRAGSTGVSRAIGGAMRREFSHVQSVFIGSRMSLERFWEADVAIGKVHEGIAWFQQEDWSKMTETVVVVPRRKVFATARSLALTDYFVADVASTLIALSTLINRHLGRLYRHREIEVLSHTVSRSKKSQKHLELLIKRLGYRGLNDEIEPGVAANSTSPRAHEPAMFFPNALESWSSQRSDSNLKILKALVRNWKPLLAYLFSRIPRFHKLPAPVKAKAPKVHIIIAASRHGTNRLCQALTADDNFAIDLREAFHWNLDNYHGKNRAALGFIRDTFRSHSKFRAHFSAWPLRTLYYIQLKVRPFNKALLKIFPGQVSAPEYSKILSLATTVTVVHRNPLAAEASAKQARARGDWSGYDNSELSVTVTARDVCNRVVGTFYHFQFARELRGAITETSYLSLNAMELRDLNDLFPSFKKASKFRSGPGFQKQDERDTEDRITNYSELAQELKSIGLGHLLNPEYEMLTEDDAQLALSFLGSARRIPPELARRNLVALRLQRARAESKRPAKLDEAS